MAKPDRIYQNLLLELRRQIAASYSAGEGLPAQRELAAMHGVSQGTVNKAMFALVGEGLLESRPQRGWVRSSTGGEPSARFSAGALRRVGIITRHNQSALQKLQNLPVHAALQREAGARGVEIVWVPNPYAHHPTPGRNRINFSRVPWQQFDAGMLLEVEQAQNLGDALLRRRKVLAVDLDATGYGIPSVAFDDRYAGCLAARHLIELGHRRLAVTLEVNDPKWPAEMTWMNRRHGFEAEAGRLGGYIHPAGYLAGSRFGKTVQRNLAAWAESFARLPDRSRPTAILITGLASPGQLMEALKKFGVEIPKHLSLVTFAFERPFAGGMALTFVRLDLAALARRAFDLAAKIVRSNDDASAPLLAPVMLKLGQSTCSARD